MNTRFLTCSLLLASTLWPTLAQTTFTKIITGDIVTDAGMSSACAWDDYDLDGRLDLFVANSELGGNNFLYRNTGNGTFAKVTMGDIITEGGNSTGCAWGDIDNDGYSDLFVANRGDGASVRPNFLYRNKQDGTFIKITTGTLATDRRTTFAGVWGDIDNDGYIDLFVGDFQRKNALYRNNGNGAFTAITTSLNDIGTSIGSAWGDYDNDGLLDLIVANGFGKNFLYHNKGNLTFQKITTGSIATDDGNSVACSWGDYDNDGFLDLFITNGGTVSTQSNFLYHNNGDGTFTKITFGSIVTDIGGFSGCAWGDYDNDGCLDLFVCNYGNSNLLYHNNGDGTFTRVTAGSPVNDAANSVGCAWGDYDNDGFLDLFVANGAYGDVSQTNFLYHNDGNANKWLTIKLVGTASNRMALGAKIRAYATIGAKAVKQLREISSGNGISGQNTLAHFGFGDAAKIDLVQIEWPSGIVQELRNLEPNHTLTVIEPPLLVGLGMDSSGSFRLSLKGGRGLHYTIERSSDLTHWDLVTSIDATDILTLLSDPTATPSSHRFYRARQD
jgi:hypothetical protein